MVLVDAEPRGHGGGYFPGIAREHDRAPHPGPLQGRQRLGRILFHHIGDDDVPNVGAVHGYVQDGADQLAFGEGHGFGLHERAVAHKHAPPVHPRGHAGTRALLHIGDATRIEHARKSLPHACGDRVVGEGLGVRGQLQQRLASHALLRMHGHDTEAAVGQSARLVEDDRAHLGKRFQIARAFHQDAAPAGRADAGEKRERHADDERAGTRHNEEHERALYAGRPALAEQNRRHKREQGRAAHDDGRVDAREASDEVFGAGLALGSLFHQLEDAIDGGLLVGARRLHHEQAAFVNAAADDWITRADGARHGFAGDGRGVELRAALDHNAVKRHALAGFHHDACAGLHVVGVDLRRRAVGAQQVRVVGGNLHHLGDRAARPVHGVVLEQLAYLVKEHDGGTLGHVRLAFGKKDEGKRADGGDGHEQVLVEGLAVHDAVPGAREHIVAGNEVGHEEAGKLDPQAVFELEGAGNRAGLHDGEDAEGDKDAVEALFVRGVHCGRPPFRGVEFADSRAQGCAGSRTLELMKPQARGMQSCIHARSQTCGAADARGCGCAGNRRPARRSPRFSGAQAQTVQLGSMSEKTRLLASRTSAWCASSVSRRKRMVMKLTDAAFTPSIFEILS